MKLSEEDVLAVIASGEGRTVEFKRGLQQDAKIARTLAAFANTRGGMLLVGVGDRGEILGSPRSRETARRLSEIAARNVEPPLETETLVVIVRARPIVCCSVPLSSARPHAVVGSTETREIVIRAGSSNRVARGTVLESLRAFGSKEEPLSDLEQHVLDWIAQRIQNDAKASAEASIDEFARATGVGKQRAKRAFVELERSGKLIGHGISVRRMYTRAP